MGTDENARKEEYDCMMSNLYASLDNESGPEGLPIFCSLLKELDQVGKRYENPTLIAQGGMKKIYRVTDAMTDRPVAMAVIHGLESPDVVEQFIREARINAQLEHPNVMPVYDIGLDPHGEPFFTMKLITGDNLNTVIKGLKNDDPKYVEAFDWSARLNIFVKVCDAVSYAHSKGVLHLDLKPENIQIGEYGEVLVCDWGLSRYTDVPSRDEATVEPEESTLTRLGAVCGTPGYLSPEQVTKRRPELDDRSDVYGLGALLYTLMTLEVSVEVGDVEVMLEATVRGDVQLPSKRCAHPIPLALEAVCMRALEREPVHRYKDVDALKHDVDSYLRGYATAAENAGFLRTLTLLANRHRPVSLTLLIVAVLGLVVVGVFTWRLSRSERWAQEKARLAENSKKEALKNLEMFRRQREKTETIGREVLPEMEEKVKRDLKNFDFSNAWAGIKRAVSIRPDEEVFRKLQACMLIGDHQFANAYAKLRQRPTRELNDYLKFSRDFARNKARKEPLSRARMTAYLLLLHTQSLDFAAVPFLKNAAYCFDSSKERADYVEGLLNVLNPESDPVTIRWKKLTDKGGVLDLSGNAKLSEIGVIALLPVMDLDISDSAVTSITIANQLPIRRLNVSGSHVKRLNGLGESPLRYLDLSRTPVTDLTPLEGSRVRELTIIDSAVINLTPLKKMPALRRLVVSDTEANRRRLRDLNLSDQVRIILR